MKDKIKLWQALILSALLFVTSIGNSYAQQVLHFVALENLGYTQVNGEGTYWDIVKAVYGNQYILNLSIVSVEAFKQHIEKQDVDGFVGVIPNEQTSNLYFPAHHINTQYASLLVHKSHTFSWQQSAQTIAVTNNDQLAASIPEKAGQYRVQNVSDIKALIENNRVDAGVVYSNMLVAIDPNVELNSTLLAPKAKVFIAYKKQPLGAKLAKDFDKAMPLLLENKVIEDLFKDHITYKHANFDYGTEKKSVQLLLPARYYDEKNQVMKPTMASISFSEALESLLGNIQFNYTVDSLGRMQTYFESDNNVCALHVAKSGTREDYAYFSQPTQIYLKPKLIIKKASTEKYELDKLANNGSLSFEQLLTSQPELRISAVKNSSVYNVLARSFSEQLMSQLYFSDNKLLHNTFDLLTMKRVDAVITYPAFMVSVLDDPAISNTLTSYDIDEITANTINTYIACSKNEFGQQFIQRINKVVSDKNNFNALFGYDIERLDKNSAKGLKQALYQ